MTIQAKIPSDKLADLSDGYRVAVEAYNVAVRLGCSMGLDVALWAIVEREARKAEAGH